MTPNRAVLRCPRCDESLPAGADRCDACGAYLVAAPAAAAGRAPSPPRSGPAPAARRRPPAAVNGWMLFIIGLLAGGAVGYTLHSAVGPRSDDDGSPPGPSDVMRGTLEGGSAVAPSMGDLAGGADAGSGGAMPGGAMPGGMTPEVMTWVQKYREALAKNPDDVQANIGFGNLLFDSSQWQKAIEHYSRALTKDPGNPDVRVDMAIAYHNLGENDRAIAELNRVTRETPSHKNAWFNLGVISSAKGDRATVIRAWERFLALEPASERASGIRAELEQMKKGS